VLTAAQEKLTAAIGAAITEKVAAFVLALTHMDCAGVELK
jgi:hypothetical protein